MAKRGKIVEDVDVLLLTPEPEELRRAGVKKVVVRYERPPHRNKWYHRRERRVFSPEVWCQFREGIYQLYLRNLVTIWFA